MIARLLVGILGGLLLGIAVAGLCMLAFGSGSGYWALLLFWIGGVGAAIAAPDLTRACRWLLISSGLATLLLVFSSAIVSDRLLPHAGDALQSAHHESDTTILLLGMLLGGLALFTGLWIGRDPQAAPRGPSAGSDVTDNFAAAGQGTSWTAQQRSLPRNRRLQYGLLALFVTFTCALLLWNARGPADAEPAADIVVAPQPAAQPPVLQASALPMPLEPQPPAPTPAPPVTASQARQECMAQVEAARLFLGLARRSNSRGDYEVNIRAELERFRRERPVGPRTLTLIATAMWGRRESPDPDTSVWSREYSQCERTRNAGSYYVVRGSAAPN